MIGGTCDPERLPGEGGSGVRESAGHRQQGDDTYNAFWEDDMGQRWDELGWG